MENFVNNWMCNNNITPHMMNSIMKAEWNNWISWIAILEMAMEESDCRENTPNPLSSAQIVKGWYKNCDQE